MRSILLEASSIERAIDKAWNEAGKPREFTIKVHDEGERNFLGFSRRPARLSILFVPQRDDNSSRSSRSRSRSNDSRRGNDRNDRRQNGRSNERSERSNERNERNGDRRSSRNSSPTRYPAESSSSSQSNGANQDWRGEWEKYVITTVRDIVKLMGITVPFEARRDDKMLTLTFKKRVLDDAEEQHMLFASLSYLSIQFLKRHYKNRFLGYRVLVACAEGSGSQEKPARKSESAAEPVEAVSRSLDGQEEAIEAAPRRRQSKSESKTIKGQDKQNDSKPRAKKSSPKGASDDIVSEQIRFAQEQLEREKAEEAAQKESAKVETAPAVEKEAKPAESAAVQEKKAEEAPAEKPAEKPKKPAKKEAPKLRRFYVMPDEEGDGGDK